MMSESAILGGDGCARTDTLVTDAVSEITLVSDAGWGATTVYYGVNSYGNLVLWEVE